MQQEHRFAGVAVGSQCVKAAHGVDKLHADFSNKQGNHISFPITLSVACSCLVCGQDENNN